MIPQEAKSLSNIRMKILVRSPSKFFSILLSWNIYVPNYAIFVIRPSQNFNEILWTQKFRATLEAGINWRFFSATTLVFDTTCVIPKWHMTCNSIITFMVIHHYFSLCQVRQVSVDCFPKMTSKNVFWWPSESVTKQLWHSLEGTSYGF